MVPTAHTGKTEPSGASVPRIAGGEGLHSPKPARGKLQEAQHHHHSSSSAHPALEHTATLTAAPDGSASQTAELTHLTFLK